MNILVLCTGNSCRSQMAEGFLRKYLDERFNVFSAGIESHGLNPDAVKTMSEIGIDISNHTSNTIDEMQDREYEYVLTVCDDAKENCPYFPAKTKYLHQGFTDPSKLSVTGEERRAAFGLCRDEIGNYCREWAEKLIAEKDNS